MADAVALGESATLAIDEVRRLYLAHAAQLRLALSRLSGPGVDADDLLQEGFVVALRKSHDLTTARSPKAWLYGVATKVAATRRRGATLRRWLGLETAEEVTDGSSPARTLEQREASKLVQTALAELSEAKREVFVLFELNGLTGEEIAAAQRIPLKTVWTRLFYARKEFAAAIQRLEPKVSGESP